MICLRQGLNLDINPITYEGGLFGTDHQIIDQNSRTALSSTSKLGDFLFLSIRHIFGKILAKSIHQGVAAVVFEMRRLEKLNIQIFCFASKPWKCIWAYKFVPGRT